jgi:hypothetical protein
MEEIFEHQQHVFGLNVFEKEAQPFAPGFVVASLQGAHTGEFGLHEVCAKVNGHVAIGPITLEKRKERSPEIAIPIAGNDQN